MPLLLALDVVFADGVAANDAAATVERIEGRFASAFGTLQPGELRTIARRGKPVWLMRRTADMVLALQQPDAALVDPLSRRSEQPKSCANATRSERPEIFVAVGVCTHLELADAQLTFRPRRRGVLAQRLARTRHRAQAPSAMTRNFRL